MLGICMHAAENQQRGARTGRPRRRPDAPTPPPFTRHDMPRDGSRSRARPHTIGTHMHVSSTDMI